MALLYSTRTAAQELSCSEATVKRLLRDGLIESVTIGRLRRIPKDTLDRFIAQHPTRTGIAGDRSEVGRRAARARWLDEPLSPQAQT